MNRPMASVALAIFLTAPVACVAQGAEPTQRQARDFANSLCLQRHLEIGRSAKNLVQMAAGINERQRLSGSTLGYEDVEKGVISSAANQGEGAAALASHVCDLAMLYASMTGQHDRELARKAVIIRSGQLVSEFEIRINRINEELPGLRSPAAVSEVQKLRDTMQVVRDGASELTARAK